jgi:hypothetical protein
MKLRRLLAVPLYAVLAPAFVVLVVLAGYAALPYLLFHAAGSWVSRRRQAHAEAYPRGAPTR